MGFLHCCGAMPVELIESLQDIYLKWQMLQPEVPGLQARPDNLPRWTAGLQDSLHVLLIEIVTGLFEEGVAVDLN